MGIIQFSPLIAMPPSTGNRTPVKKFDESLAKKDTALTQSLEYPMRSSGFSLVFCSTKSAYSSPNLSKPSFV